MSVIVGRALPDVRDGFQARAPPDPLRDVRRWVPPDRGFFKCAAVVGDVLGSYHPHGDSAVYDALVRMVQPWALRYPLVDGRATSAPRQRPGGGLPVHRGAAGPVGHGDGARHRRGDRRLQTELRRPLAGAGHPSEPVPEPAGQRQLGDRGRAWPRTSRRTTSPRSPTGSGALEHPDASKEELLEALIERVQGPDFPTGAYIVGRAGIDAAHRTGPRIHHHARCRGHRGGRPWSHLPGDHRAALPGEPDT